MLVLSRNIKQQIYIGDNVVVTILQVKGEMVKIGIEAPKNVRLLRAEIAHRSEDPTPAMAESAGGEAKGTAQSECGRSEANGSDTERRDVSPPSPGRRPAARSPRATPMEGFSPPARDGREPLGESTGLFPFLRERALHAATRVEAPISDGGAGQFVL